MVGWCCWVCVRKVALSPLRVTANLKVPFVLKGNVRVDDTPQHQAVREALVNTLVHADYSDRAAIKFINMHYMVA